MMTSILNTARRSVFALVLAGATVATAAEVRLQGGGATFPAPLYLRWVAEYQKAHPDVKIDYQSIGSGGGIKGITDKTFHFAGSDAPMNKKEFDAAGGQANFVEVPSVAGAVVPAYNLPGIKELNFTGDVLASIFMGKITAWNDPQIAALNPGVTLPTTSITSAWRTDGSGTTFVFTNYLATQSEEFKSTVGPGKQVKWPLGQGGKGNEGVSAVVQQNPGAIGYIELNYATANNIAFGSVKNTAGEFVKASTETVSAAGTGAAAKLSGNVLAADIWNQPGAKAYPISAFTYLIVYKDLGTGKPVTDEEGKALTDFLWWATHDGQKLATEMGYAPLAEPVQRKVEAALKTVSNKGTPMLSEGR